MKFQRKPPEGPSSSYANFLDYIRTLGYSLDVQSYGDRELVILSSVDGVVFAAMDDCLRSVRMALIDLLGARFAFHHPVILPVHPCAERVIDWDKIEQYRFVFDTIGTGVLTRFMHLSSDNDSRDAALHELQNVYVSLRHNPDYEAHFLNVLPFATDAEIGDVLFKGRRLSLRSPPLQFVGLIRDMFPDGEYIHGNFVLDEPEDPFSFVGSVKVHMDFGDELVERIEPLIIQTGGVIRAHRPLDYDLIVGIARFYRSDDNTDLSYFDRFRKCVSYSIRHIINNVANAYRELDDEGIANILATQHWIAHGFDHWIRI